MFGFQSYHLRTTQQPLQDPTPIGPIVTVLCDLRSCVNRAAPVFLVLGAKGALALCATCRARHHHLIRTVVPELRREGR